MQNAQGEHSALLLTFIKLPFVIKIFVFSISETLSGRFTQFCDCTVNCIHVCSGSISDSQTHLFQLDIDCRNGLSYSFAVELFMVKTYKAKENKKKLSECMGY